jgi:hypothetical protein
MAAQPIDISAKKNFSTDDPSLTYRLTTFEHRLIGPAIFLLTSTQPFGKDTAGLAHEVQVSRL